MIGVTPRNGNEELVRNTDAMRKSRPNVIDRQRFSLILTVFLGS